MIYVISNGNQPVNSQNKADKMSLPDCQSSIGMYVPLMSHSWIQ